jgi:phosphopantetheine adenylyltransferase
VEWHRREIKEMMDKMGKRKKENEAKALVVDPEYARTGIKVRINRFFSKILPLGIRKNKKTA